MNPNELLEKLKPNPDNPRKITKDEFEQLKESLQVFTKMLKIRPIAYDEQYIVWGGNMRLSALKLLAKEGLELKESYFISLAGFTEDEKKQFAIRDNIQFGGWDAEILKNKWTNLPLAEWGLIEDEWNKEKLDDEYSQKLGEVIYEPKESKHQISDIFTPEIKYNEEINKLTNEPLKEMLKARVAYFSTFNFSKIADYYAYQATPEEQRIMEKLALVLLDKDKLIEYGFSKLMTDVTESENEEQP